MQKKQIQWQSCISIISKDNRRTWFVPEIQKQKNELLCSHILFVKKYCF